MALNEVVIVRLLPTALDEKVAESEVVDKETTSPLITPTSAALVLLTREVALAEASYTLSAAVRPEIVSDFAVISAEVVGCVST